MILNTGRGPTGTSTHTWMYVGPALLLNAINIALITLFNIRLIFILICENLGNILPMRTAFVFSHSNFINKVCPTTASNAISGLVYDRFLGLTYSCMGS